MSYRTLVTCNIEQENDDYSIDFSYEDSEGRYVEQSIQSDDLESAISELTKDVLDTLEEQAQLESEEGSNEEVEGIEYIEYLEDRLDEVTEKNEVLMDTIEKLKNRVMSLELDNQVLQQRADDAVNKPENNETKDGFEPRDYIKDFYSLLDSDEWRDYTRNVVKKWLF